MLPQADTAALHGVPSCTACAGVPLDTPALLRLRVGKGELLHRGRGEPGAGVQREEVHGRYGDRRQETRMESPTKVGRLGSSSCIFQPIETEAENPNQDPFLIISPFYVFEHWKLSQSSPRSILLVLFGIYFFHVVSFVFSAASQMSLVASSAIAPPPPVPLGGHHALRRELPGSRAGPWGAADAAEDAGTEVTMKQLWEFMVCYGLLIDHIGINI